MSHKLNDITLYYYPRSEYSRKFTLKQNMVSDLYIQYLGGYKPPKTSRVSVELCESDCIIGYFGSILSVNVKFDKDHYWTLNDNEQKKEILDTVHRVAMLCSEKYEWDKKVFLNAYEQVLKSNFKYEFEGKIKNSRDRNHKAAIQIKKDESATHISVVFYDKSNKQIKNVELFKTYQHEIFYGSIIKKNKWFNNREFGVYNSDEEIIIKASLDNDKSEVIIEPKIHKKEHLEGILVNWINK